MVGDYKMSETLDKVLDAAKVVTTEPAMKIINQRLSNPFFLCFISSWALCNWDRVLLLFFSFSLGMEQRIEKVKALPSNSVFFGVSIPHAHTLWYPFIFSMVFVIGAPFITYLVDIFQNGVLTKKNTNDSQRKKDVLDLKISEINKNIEYEYADAKARLNAENANKAIEYSTVALEEKYNDMQVRVRSLNTSIKENEKEIAAQNNSLEQSSLSLLKVREELDLKGRELLELNAKIISNQKTLDDIKQRISKNTLPISSLGNLTNLSNLSNLSNLTGIGNLASINVKDLNRLGDEVAKLKLANESSSIKSLKPVSIKKDDAKESNSMDEKSNKNNAKEAKSIDAKSKKNDKN